MGLCFWFWDISVTMALYLVQSRNGWRLVVGLFNGELVVLLDVHRSSSLVS